MRKQNNHNLSRWQATRKVCGFVLIEALLSFVVVALGLLAIAKLNAYVQKGSASSKARVEALAIADGKIEQFRSLALESDFTAIGSSATPTTVTGTNASYSLSWTVTPSTTPEYKTVSVTVSWKDVTDPTGVSQSVTLRSLVAWDDPTHSSTLASNELPGKGQTINPPTGRARFAIATDTSFDVDNLPAGSVDNLDGTTIASRNGSKYLIDSTSGNVILVIDDGTDFSTISGEVLIDQTVSAAHRPAPADVYVLISDAAYCQRGATSSYAASGVTKYLGYHYTCYLGAAWYGNIGIARTDSANTSQRVCLGDPAVLDSYSYTTSSTSRRPVLQTARMYRGYRLVDPDGTPSSGDEYYLSTGIGVHPVSAVDDREGIYVAAHITTQDFLITRITGAPADSACAAKLSLVTSPNPFTGNAGKFYCLSPTTSPTNSKWACPSPLPGPGVTTLAITLTGTITRDATDAAALVSSVTIEGGSCSLSSWTGSPPKHATYTCNIELDGWAGTTWNTTLTVSGTTSLLCKTGTPVPDPNNTSVSSNQLVYTNEPPAIASVTQNFMVTTAATCP